MGFKIKKLTTEDTEDTEDLMFFLCDLCVLCGENNLSTTFKSIFWRAFHTGPYHRIKTAPQVTPAPKADIITTSPRFNRLVSTHSSSAIGIEADDVLPTRLIFA